MNIKVGITLLAICLASSSVMAHGSRGKAEDARKRARAHAAWLQSIPALNESNQRRFAFVLERSKKVTMTPSAARVSGVLGGPAALYTSLSYHSPLTDFNTFVANGRDQHWLAELKPGQGLQAPHLIRALMQLELGAKEWFFDTPEDKAAAALRASFAGKGVFFDVPSAAAYRSLTLQAPPAELTGRHVVSLVGVLRDRAGYVEQVAVYDANVFNSKTPAALGPRYLTYPQYLRLMRMTEQSNFASLVITEQPIW